MRWTKLSTCGILYRRFFIRLLDYTSKNSCCQEMWQRYMPVSRRIFRTLMEQQKRAQSIVRRARGLQRIASILDAAETVFARMGYEEATTNHIAAQAAISPAWFPLSIFLQQRGDCSGSGYPVHRGAPTGV